MDAFRSFLAQPYVKDSFEAMTRDLVRFLE
jgi:hypothetical protein